MFGIFPNNLKNTHAKNVYGDIEIIKYFESLFLIELIIPIIKEKIVLKILILLILIS